MKAVSAKKTEEVALLKWERDQARKHLRNGRDDYRQSLDTDLAREFELGNLQEKTLNAEQAYGNRKQEGIAVLLSRVD